MLLAGNYMEVREATGVVEGADSYMAYAVCFVFGSQERLFHIVEVNANAGSDALDSEVVAKYPNSNTPASAACMA